MNSISKSKLWQIMVHCVRGLKMINEHPQISHMEETVNVKWCVSKVLQYIY